MNENLEGEHKYQILKDLLSDAGNARSFNFDLCIISV
jgi:hypothetical protein